MGRATNRGANDPPSAIFTIVGVVLIFSVVIGLGFMRINTEVVSTSNSVSSAKSKSVELVRESNLGGIEQMIVSPETLKRPTEVRFPSDPLVEPGLHVILPFGRDAVDRCLAQCGMKVDSCGVECERYMAVAFARRILPNELRPSELASNSLESCREVSLSKELELVEVAELRRLLEPLSIFERSEISKRIASAGRLFSRLQRGSGTPDAQSRALCVLEGVLTSELAIAESASQKDSFSEMFYRKFEERLIQELPLITRDLGKV